MTDRELLRLHIEACWGISIPPLEHAGIELPASTKLPAWSLYQANLSHEQVTIWRLDVSPEQRANLLQRAHNADVVFDAALGMRSEVVLRFSAMPQTPRPRQQYDPRLLTADDTALLETFEAGSAPYFLDSPHAPCIGVIVMASLSVWPTVRVGQRRRVSWASIRCPRRAVGGTPHWRPKPGRKRYCAKG